MESGRIFCFFVVGGGGRTHSVQHGTRYTYKHIVAYAWDHLAEMMCIPNIIASITSLFLAFTQLRSLLEYSWVVFMCTSVHSAFSFHLALVCIQALVNR